MERIIIIGGLSAGPSAAAKARRENENAEILLFEKGENISYATCGMPYAFSGIIENRKDLIVVDQQLMKDRFNIDVRINEEIINIDTDKKIVYSKNNDYSYDKLIFTTGAKSIVPPIKNIKFATNWSTCRSMVDFDKIMKEGLASSSKNITIIGAGLIGIEVAENLHEAGKKVTLIEGDHQILNMWQSKFANFAETIFKSEGIDVLTSSIVKEFELDETGKIIAVKIEGKEAVKTDFVIMSVGIKPNTELLLKNGAKHIENGALIVNERMETSIKNVFAAGDNVSIKNLQTNEFDYFPLGTHSNKGGRAAGANAVGKNIVFK
ncbi:FAD-dependent oxidoreductase, partial [Lutibacter sp.]|uniref:NAD(P)/FAD-dependent oxidoreductase n=1 Tax=Lutibacter sp. TaxID=1925666 RepID=UPI0035670109